MNSSISSPPQKLFHPKRQVQWKVVSFALMGFIVGFLLQLSTAGSSFAQEALVPPSPPSQPQVIRPPNPSFPAQGGGCRAS